MPDVCDRLRNKPTGNTRKINMKQIYVVLKSGTTETDDWQDFRSKLLSAWTDKGNAFRDADQSDMHMEAFDAHSSNGRFYFDAALTQEIPIFGGN